MKPSGLLRAALVALLVGTGLLLGSCSRGGPAFKLTNITGHMPDLKFQLTNDQGKAVTAADYRGNVVLLYFGYTHCPDVCPLTLAHIHAALNKLGAEADGARILFVTVDPTRDTPSVLHAYVNAFDQRAVGLTGTPAAIEALSKRYRSAFSREPGDGHGNYEVSHSSGIYVFDRKGHPRVLSTPGTPQADLVHDLDLLLNEKVAT
ncbi:MAG: SCO family protein [Rhodanobacter sp.]|nr:MAG: SCO family protein [Rhodanobacter sp.]TAM14517.1 MAG: SCO family protein [Rhodanobacter sp.]TAM37308.1 MAG: SCO family protein [Rhodanobacter sp.]